MRRTIFGTLTAMLALGTSSCLVVTPPGAHMSPPVAVDDFCTRLAQVTCDGFERCCDDPAVLSMAPTHSDCVQAVQTNCTSGTYSISTAIHDPRTGYDPFVGGAVIGRMQDFVARCDPSMVVFTGRRDGFESALQGTVASGAQCLNGNALMNYPAFLSCMDFDQACILESDLTHGSCNQRRAAGDRCVLDFDCAEGLYCQPITLSITGMCAPRLANGSPCAALDGTPNHSWCASGYCYHGACETPTRTHVYCGDSTVPTM